MAKKALTDYEWVAMIEQNGKLYAYALYDDDVVAGNEVIVTGTASKDIWRVTLIYAAGNPELKDIDVCEEVICKVDTSAYKARVKKRKEEAELKAKLGQRRAKLIESIGDEYLDGLDPEYKKLREQLKELRESKPQK